MRKSRQFLLSRSNIFFWYLRSSWCAISNNQETIGRTRNETFQTKLFHPTRNEGANETFSPGRMSTSRSRVTFVERALSSSKNNNALFRANSLPSVHLLLSVTISRTKFPEYIYLVSALGSHRKFPQ